MIYISVNKAKVRDPDANPIRISMGKRRKPWYAKAVKIHGPSKIVFSPEKPLPWGARLWIETDSDVRWRP